MKKFLAILTLFITVLTIGCSNNTPKTDNTKSIKTDSQNTDNKQVPAKKSSRPDFNATAKELEQIKVNIIIDHGVKLDGKQKYVVNIKNDSEKRFIGNVFISTPDASFTDSLSIDLDLQPEQKHSAFSFGKNVNSQSKFNIQKEGKFEVVEFKKAVSVPDYKIVKRMVGEVYATFWVKTSKTDDASIIAISKELYDNYKDTYKMGFQIRFVDPRTGSTESDAIAVFAQSKAANNRFAHVLSFTTGTEREIANF